MLIATTHKNTDFDALASVIAVTILYPECTGVIPKMTNKNVGQFLSTHKNAFNLILPNEVKFDEVSKLIVVDTDQWHRLDRMEKLRQREDLTIYLWDHHMAGRGDIKADRLCKERIGATVSLLVREMRKRKMSLNALDSTVLLIGLYEDTGHLTYPSTTSEDARAAAYLLDNEADLNVAGFFLNPPYEETQKDILFEMMKKTEKTTINGQAIGFNIIHLTQKVTNLATIVSMYRKIANVAALFAIFIDDKRLTIIGRSGIEQINIGQIMAMFGGGGHAGAGSATVKNGKTTAADIKEKITCALAQQKSESPVVADIMSFPVFTISPETTMRQAQNLMIEKNIRGIMVTCGDAIEGIIVGWDLKKLKKKNQWESPVKAFMSRDIITISPTDSPTTAARIMIENDVGHLPVIQDKVMIGIVTRTDVLTYYYDLLPG